MKGPEEDESKFNVQIVPGGSGSPLGYGPPITLKTTFSWAEWFREPINRAAWEEIMEQSNGQLTSNVFDEIDPDKIPSHYGFLEMGTLAQNKVRIFGFNGFVDSLESVFEMYQEYSAIKMLPSLKVSKAQFLI